MAVHCRRFAALLVLILCVGVAAAAESGDWSTLAVIRFGNIDAIDAEDGELAAFMKSIRNDGRFIPPLRFLAGPEIRNTTFFGIAFEGWLERVTLIPSTPGPTRHVWVFPVDNRDEYMAQLVNFGLSEYEGMDGVTRLRELDADGNSHTWFMEWLPGNVAIFGSHGGAVTAARRIYADSAAAGGLLARAGMRHIEPDVVARLEPSRLVAWQDEEYGVYWWREKIGKLTTDLVNFWQPGPSRERLINAFAEQFVLWPRGMDALELSVWFERDGVEWRLGIREREAPPPVRGELNSFRQTPERAALAYAVPVSEERFDALGKWIGDFLVGAAGGVVSQEARAAAATAFAPLEDAGLREATACWIAPPGGSPELGGARLLLCDWIRPESLAGAFERAEAALKNETPIANAFAQMGVKVEFEPFDGDPDARILRITPVRAGAEAEPYYFGGIVARRRGDRLALAVGEGRPDSEQMRRCMEYRGVLADEALAYDGDGMADVRNAFSRMGPSGGTLVGVFDPVRFLQLCLIEAADWRPRSPDQLQPMSTQLAREMLEYGSGRAWTISGDGDAGSRIFTGIVPWQSLSRLSAALGITESISMNGVDE